MKLSIREHIVRIVVIAPEERVDAFSAPRLRSRFEEFLAQGVSKFVVDLSLTPFLDSAGMAALVSLLKNARLTGGDVKLVWPKEEAAQRTLRLTKFDRVFEMADTADLALERF
ncbi:MAG: STAS domain-containing protein [Caldilineaceae bacterium]|nr:STAS domain-containing protein [Caldilineaceae bacterium]MBP8107066.1 STAS domain-containing protein [Caldilineaceae bacterium]MBP8121104.1 STAS domain-containing protein [Caldilineaceae bacterium]MBP9070779.1 STAS domain-containing protein [Caldilineaceae bacterium]